MDQCSVPTVQLFEHFMHMTFSAWTLWANSRAKTRLPCHARPTVRPSVTQSADRVFCENCRFLQPRLRAREIRHVTFSSLRPFAVKLRFQEESLHFSTLIVDGQSLFLPSAKPHGQQMAFGVREEGGISKKIIFNIDLDLEMTLTLK